MNRFLLTLFTLAVCVGFAARSCRGLEVDYVGTDSNGLIVTHCTLRSTGTVTAAEFSGTGSALSNLNASALGTGTVPLARLTGITSNQIDAETDAAYRSGGGTGGAEQWSTSNDTYVATNRYLTGKVSSSDATFELHAGQIDSGGMDVEGRDLRLVSGDGIGVFSAQRAGDVVAVMGGTNTTVGGRSAEFRVEAGGRRLLSVSSTGFVDVAVALRSDLFMGDASGMTNLRSSALVIDHNIDLGGYEITGGSFAGGTVQATLFAGNGSSVTNLNAASLASGTVPDGRLSTNSTRTMGGLWSTGTVTAARFVGDGAAMTNLSAGDVRAGSNNTYAAETTQYFARVASSSMVVTAQGAALTVQNPDASASIQLVTTNTTTQASLIIKSSQTSTRPVLRYIEGASTDAILLSGASAGFGLSSRRDVGTYGNWGNQINAGLTDTGIGFIPGRAFWVSTAIASSTTGDGWLLFNLDPATSYQDSAITINGGRRFRNLWLYGVSNTILLSANMSNSTVQITGHLRATTSTVVIASTNAIDTTYTNTIGGQIVLTASVTLTNNGVGYAHAALEVGGVIQSEARISQSATNRVVLSGYAAAGQTWSVTNLSVGGSAGLTLLMQRRD